MKQKLSAYKVFTSFLVLVLCVGFSGARAVGVRAAEQPLFSVNLTLGSRHAEVKLLQEYLNTHGFRVAEAGPGSPGQETTTFGLRTQQALARFQEAHAADILVPQGLSRGTGKLFAATRSYLNAHRGTVPTVAGVSTTVPNFGEGVYKVGGTIHGLTGPVTLKNNSDILVVQPNGPAQFEFPTKLSTGQAYAVTVAMPPAGKQCFMRPGETGAGVIAQWDVTNIEIQCTALTGWNPFIPLAMGPSEYTVGGTVSGLSGTVVLQNNGADTVNVSANGAFVFPTRVGVGNAYAVTVLTQPAEQTCTVSNGSGTVASRNVTSVAVSCINTGPVVTGISPANGPTSGGTSVLITGTNFTGATAVRFGASMATSIFVLNSTTISVTTPAGSLGAVHVTVTTPAGTSATSSADIFTYFTLEEAWVGPHWSGSYAVDMVRKEYIA